MNNQTATKELVDTFLEKVAGDTPEPIREKKAEIFRLIILTNDTFVINQTARFIKNII